MADPKKLATSFVTSTAAPISFLGRHSHALDFTKYENNTGIYQHKR